jgi:predicted membrane metal-binding protein
MNYELFIQHSAFIIAVFLPITNYPLYGIISMQAVHRWLTDKTNKSVMALLLGGLLFRVVIAIWLYPGLGNNLLGVTSSTDLTSDWVSFCWI